YSVFARGPYKIATEAPRFSHRLFIVAVVAVLLAPYHQCNCHHRPASSSHSCRKPAQHPYPTPNKGNAGRFNSTSSTLHSMVDSVSLLFHKRCLLFGLWAV